MRLFSLLTSCFIFTFFLFIGECDAKDSSDNNDVEKSVSFKADGSSRVITKNISDKNAQSLMKSRLGDKKVVTQKGMKTHNTEMLTN